jgi:hypothetical protein
MVRVLQILTPGASQYERKAQRLDLEMAARENEVETMALTGGNLSIPEKDGWSVVHVYGPPDSALPLLRKLRLPYVASSRPERPFLRWPGAGDPAASSSPLEGLPEAVDAEYLAVPTPRFPRVPGRYAIGSCLPDRDGVREICHTTMSRLASFRDDVEWLLFDETPSAEEMAQADVWVDPTTDLADWDGASAEAMAGGILTIASRTPIALLRSGDGAAGILVRPGDPNELTHALARALFRPETTVGMREAASERAAQFEAGHRWKRLAGIYREIQP